MTRAQKGEKEPEKGQVAECPGAADRSGVGRGAERAGTPLDVEATTIDEILESLADDALAASADEPPEDVEPVFDDDFIRARRALNAARRGNVGAVLGLGADRGTVAGAAGREAPAVGRASGKPLGRSCGGSVAGSLGESSEEPFEEPFEDAVPVPDDGLTEQILDSRAVWHGSFLTAEDVAVRLPNGRVGQRDVLRHPGGVAVIALTTDGKIVLVHQYRTALEQVTLEIPAGKLLPGEDPAQAAARELMEETGYTAARMAYLGPIAMAPGYCDEIIHLYMAVGLSFVGASPDDDEFLHVDLVDLDDMVDAVLDGKVIDAKTVAGVMLCDAISRRMDQ